MRIYSSLTERTSGDAHGRTHISDLEASRRLRLQHACRQLLRQARAQASSQGGRQRRLQPLRRGSQIYAQHIGLSFFISWMFWEAESLRFTFETGQLLSKCAIMVFPKFLEVILYGSVWLDRYFLRYETLCARNIVSNIMWRLFVSDCIY